MLLKCCTQYTSKFGKLSSGHRTGKGQFSFQSQRKAMPKNVQSESKSLSVMSDSLRPHGLSPWNSPGQNTGVGSLSLLQGICPTQELNWDLLHCRRILECSDYRTVALISHTSEVMLKILQARLQQNLNRDVPDVQAGFRKARGIRDQIANICWIIKRAREFQKNICIIDYTKVFVWITTNYEKFFKRWEYQTTRPAF